AAISALVGWFFARQGSRQLAETHGQVALLLRGLQEAGIVELNRNEAGEATGVVIRLSANLVGTSHASADLTVTPHTETPPDRFRQPPGRLDADRHAGEVGQQRQALIEGGKARSRRPDIGHRTGSGRPSGRPGP
ncbi:MAG TPA: hypothetical protein VGW38_02905, partial [Chloroflexota bacterium]|nr:hypothetical protein [Chloroflexota bacterium]